MHLLVGLGNPGPEYERNRHNIGFMVIDAIAERHGFPNFRSRFQGLISEKLIDGEKVMLLKPMTYMNKSGQSVGEAARYFKLHPSHVVVVHDEMDLALGKTKMKTGGGSAGHNGIRSIDAHLETPDYRRLRLGVGHPGVKDRVHKHVLSDFSKADTADVKDWVETIAACAPSLIKDDGARFLNDLALALAPTPNTATKDQPTKNQNSREDGTASKTKTGIASAFEAALAKMRGK